jgi:hypothetical protein
VERPFFYAEQSLLNGRTFRSLEHLNEVTAWWLANVADVRVHRETKQRPLDRHAEERPLLLPLPDAAYHVDAVCYRVVNVEGDVAYRANAYSLNAVERILAAQAQPKNLLDIMADQDQCQLPPHLTDNPVAPRPATDYHCLLEETTDHEPPQENSTSRHDPDNPPAEDAGRSP